MEAAGVNTWLVPSELALSDAFLAILQYEYRGYNLDVQIELTPLNNIGIYRVYIQWRSPSKLDVYRLIARSRHQFVVRSIVVKLV